MSKEKMELIAISCADEMLVQAMNTIRSTATAPPLPAMAWDTVEFSLSEYRNCKHWAYHTFIEETTSNAGDQDEREEY